MKNLKIHYFPRIAFIAYFKIDFLVLKQFGRWWYQILKINKNDTINFLFLINAHVINTIKLIRNIEFT